MDHKNNFDIVMKELKERKRTYIDEKHLMFDAMMYELRAVTYFTFLKIESFHTTDKEYVLIYNFRN